MSQDDSSVVVITGGVGLEPSVQLSDGARRAGALAILDLGTGDPWIWRTLDSASGHLGVRVTAECSGFTPEDLRRVGGARTVILAADAPWLVADLTTDYRVLVEVTGLAEAWDAIRNGAHRLIARGMESGGRASELSSYVLLQQFMADPAIIVPVWVAGGIGPRTAAACRVGGAAGVVLDSQLALIPEALTPDELAAVRRMDSAPPAGGPIGADGALAADFARRWPDTAAAVRAVKAAMASALEDDEACELLRPRSPMAESLGVRLPLVQGPTTRVSDEAGFAAAVATGGGLPFIALAPAIPEQTWRILAATAEALGERSWGFGVLGFAAAELRNAQLEVVREITPQVAIIAGGRPAQAAQLEADGVKTFLHVPSRGCYGSSSRPDRGGSSSRVPNAVAKSVPGPAFLQVPTIVCGRPVYTTGSAVDCKGGRWWQATTRHWLA